jgi:sterol desaturase/sphingolipid hydroxylase (fatty acid hydroxylase superfamily)
MGMPATRPGELPDRPAGTVLALAWVALGAASALVAASPSAVSAFLDAALPVLSRHVRPDKAVYSPIAYWCLLTAAWGAHRWRPATPAAFFTAAFRQDLLWYLLTMASRLLFLSAFVAALGAVYRQNLGFLEVRAVAAWHPAAQFLAGVLVADFARWLSHLLRHKVPLFWRFHALHHSQRDLNLFTDARVHPVDRMVSASITTLVLLSLGNTTPVVIAWLVFETVYPKLYHANLRANFGWLRFLLVTPQSHRVHHSVEPQHHDRNFGFIFSIWDWLFGTQYAGGDDYPSTGIPDEDFPLESSGTPGDLLRTTLRQLWYPIAGGPGKR